MISAIAGIIELKSPPQIVIMTAGGVAYELDVSMNTYCNLPELGQSVRVFTQLLIREDGHYLVGFLSEDERLAFRLLLKVSGIGAKIALAVLSGLTLEDLSLAIAGGDSARLVKVPGIGKKTAERMILELQDKFPRLSGKSQTNNKQLENHDTLNALLALGYQEKEARAALQLLPDGLSTSDAIRQSLRHLARL